MIERAVAAALLVLAAAAPACRRAPAAPPSEAVRAVLEKRIGPAGTDAPVNCRRDRVCGSDVLARFYRDRAFRPAWVDDGLVLGNARAFLSALRLVSGDGLDPSNYHLAALESLLEGVDREVRRRPARVPSEDLADLEMLLTDGFLLCGSHLVHGEVDPATLQADWSVKGRAADLAAALEKGLAANDVPGAIEALRPAGPVYRGLRTLHAEYARRAEAGGWPAFPVGPKLVKGDTDARVGALRKSLQATGDLAAADDPGDPDHFDAGLEAALMSFQSRHGLDPDGVVGADTEAALNVSAADRLKQVKANLERWRWITPDLGDRYILVNTASFFVWVVEAGRAVLTMEAIVGRAYLQTPDFSGRLSTVTINPAWNVPQEIARKDVLPLVQKDPDYLRKNGFRVFESWSDGARELDPAAIDWSRITEDGLSYKFRQDPGPKNALGELAFIFPNPFGVYMHDTPARGLFRRAVRDFSHGCIRLEKALDLAAYLLRDDPDWTEDKIQEAIDAGETKVVRVPEPVSVHVLYWTAWLGDDGRAQFREDIYLRDAALVRALGERAAPPPR